MRLGRHLRELWDYKVGVAIVVVVALLAAGRTYAGPGFPSGPPDTARAATHVFVDTPQSSIVDLRQDTYDLEGLTSRALLVGNAMASLPVREQIADRAGVPAAAIMMNTPLDAQYPQSTSAGAGSPATDLVAAPSEYQLDIQANKTVPVIDIGTEAPTGVAAVRLANAAADGLAAYLRTAATADATPENSQIKLVQLGRAQVVPVRVGAGFGVALFVFAFVFALASATVLFLARVRRGWAAADDRLDRAATGSGI
jgi:hypothetical protein